MIGKHDFLLNKLRSSDVLWGRYNFDIELLDGAVSQLWRQIMKVYRGNDWIISNSQTERIERP